VQRAAPPDGHPDSHDPVSCLLSVRLAGRDLLMHPFCAES